MEGAMCEQKMDCRRFVLIVDDEDDVRDALENLLRLDGHAVVAVKNGEQAVGALAVAIPMVVLTDLSMPIHDGHGLITWLRSDERTRAVPICVVSAQPGDAPDGTIPIGKELVGGFVIIEAADYEEAIRIASLHPAARMGEELGWGIEVRPMEYCQLKQATGETGDPFSG
jgi:CheY-like chemotaxis protein